MALLDAGPVQHRIFFAIWTASLVSNFGSLIQGVGASWLMTSIAPSADMVALVQAASSLPIMLFSLLAGAAADLWDRRNIMLVAQAAMLLISAALSFLAFSASSRPGCCWGLPFCSAAERRFTVRRGNRRWANRCRGTCCRPPSP